MVVKNKILKLYYYYYWFSLRKPIKMFFFSLDTRIINFFPKKYRKWIKFTIRDLFRIVIILSIIKNMIFDDFIIYTYFLPYYGLYYFILNIVDFTKKMTTDFDYALYYTYIKNDCITETGNFKLKQYQKFLILGYSEFLFLNRSIAEKYNLPKTCLSLSLDKDFK